MPACLVGSHKPCLALRIIFLGVVILLLSGWTCTAIIGFSSCPGTVPQPQIVSLSPDTIARGSESVLLIVIGSGFVPQSQIMWNGNPLATTFTDVRQLQTTITQQTFESFGGAAGGGVQISVASTSSTSLLGCPNGISSATLVLRIH
jgi:hypothetical protein